VCEWFQRRQKIRHQVDVVSRYISTMTKGKCNNRNLKKKMGKKTNRKSVIKILMNKTTRRHRGEKENDEIFVNENRKQYDCGNNNKK
jgi:predicted transcriptional regulator